jgi:hypothetical protein
MGRYKGEPRITTSITISSEFFNLCKQNFISFTEAARVGISLLLAEKGIKDYDNNLNIYRKMTLMRIQLEETSQKLAEMEEKYGK